MRPRACQCGTHSTTGAWGVEGRGEPEPAWGPTHHVASLPCHLGTHWTMREVCWIWVQGCRVPRGAGQAFLLILGRTHPSESSQPEACLLAHLHPPPQQPPNGIRFYLEVFTQGSPSAWRSFLLLSVCPPLTRPSTFPHPSPSQRLNQVPHLASLLLSVSTSGHSLHASTALAPGSAGSQWHTHLCL